MAKEIILSTRVDLGDSQSELSRLKKSITELREEQKKLNKQLKDGDITAEEYAKSMVKVDLALKPLNAQYTKTIRNQTTLNTNMTKGIKTVDGLRTKLSQLTVEWKSVEIGSKRFKELEKEIKDTSEELKKLESNVGNNTRDVGNYGKAIQGVSKSLKRMGALLVTVWAGRAIKNAFNIIKDFEQAQANLAAITEGTEKELKKMSRAAKELGGNTIFTAKQVTELQTEFAKLGFSTQEILNATEATLQLAAATGTDLAEAAKVAGATVRGFGLDSSETQRVVDVMAKSFSSSALDMEKFKTAMASVAPVAKSAGLSIEETTSFLAVLVDRGVDASTAGTGLRNIFLDLSKHGLTFNEAMSSINASSDKNAEALRLFGKRGATVATILASTAGETANLNKELQGAAGTAQEMADKQLDTLQGSITLLSSAWEGFILGIEEGDGILGKVIRGGITLLSNFLQDVTEGFKTIQQLNEETQQSIEDNALDLAKLGIAGILDEELRVGDKIWEDRIENVDKFIERLEISQENALELSIEEADRGELNLSLQQQLVFEELERFTIKVKSLELTQEEFELLKDGVSLAEIEKRRLEEKLALEGEILEKKKKQNEFAEGSLGALQKEISELQKLLKATGDDDERAFFQSRINATKEEIDVIKRQLEDIDPITRDNADEEHQAQVERMQASQRIRDAENELIDEDNKKKQETQLAHLKLIQKAAFTFGQISADFIKSQNADTEEEREKGRKQALAGLASFLIDQITMQTNAAIFAAVAGSATTPQSIFSFGAIGAVQGAILTALINGAAGLAKGLIRGSFAEGGFTGSGDGLADATGHEVRGVVHANEYVVPTKVLSTPQGGQMVGLLEAMRRGSFADGGFTTPTMTSSQISANQLSSDIEGIDIRPVVSVVEIREGLEDDGVRIDNSRL